MTPERWRQVEGLLERALPLAAEERRGLLDRACAQDPDLRAEVETLLVSADRLDGFLEPRAWAAPGSPEEPPRDGSSGRQLGPYRLERCLGAGGMGEVYLAHDSRLQRRVALKLLDPALARDERWRERFLREARLASTLDHPGICTVHEVGEAGGAPFIAMQYVEGRSLTAEIDGAPLPLSRLLQLALEIADALATAHACGVLHRDVKSQNILVNTRGQAVVLDFGIAKRLTEEASPAELRLTATGAVLGTPTAMSPEQAAGEPVDERSDLFSFGVVLYEMATGRLPFAGGSRLEVLRALLAQPHRPARELAPSLPVRLSSLLDRLLAKSPTDRPSAMAEVLLELRAIAEECGAFPSGAATGESGWGSSRAAGRVRVSGRARLRRPLRLAAVAVALAVAVAAAVVLLGPHAARKEPIRSIAVLPFKPLVEEGRDESLEVGMAETLIGRLAGLEGIRVRPLSAVRRYSGLEQDPLAAGREQRVDAVLDGRIQRVGERVRITAELLGVQRRAVLWSARFQGETADLFALQDAISEQVATALAIELSGEDRRRLRRHVTDDPEAYRHYLLAQFHAAKRTREGIDRAVEAFGRARDQDPGFARAWSGLAASQVIAAARGYAPREETLREAEAAARRALELDPTLAEPHAVLASLRRREWDWAGAEEAYRRALDREPLNPTVNHWYGLHLSSLGRAGEAIAVLGRAREVDPVSPVINLALGSALLAERRHEEALAQFRLVLELDSAFPSAHYKLGDTLFALGREAEAVDAWLAGERLTGASAAQLEEIDEAWRREGMRGFWSASLAWAARRGGTDQYSPLVLAAFHLGLDDHEAALRTLEAAWEVRDPDLELLLAEIKLDPLRDDPRFTDLVRRVGLAR